MGYNTVAVILNDAIGTIERDPGFGARLAAGVLRFDRSGSPRFNNEVFAKAGMGSADAVKLVSCESSYHYQVVIVGGNAGWHLGDDRRGSPPPEAMDQLVRTMRLLGYKVTPPKPLPATSNDEVG